MQDIFVEHISYAGIVIALILTGTGLPIPEEVFVILAGVASSEGSLNPGLAFASCLTGAILGDLLTYGLGHQLGRNVLREHPRLSRFLTPDRERQIEAMIQRHGLKVFFLARFLVGLRSPMYLTAGILRVPFRRFIIVDTFCATTVIGFFFWLSYRFAAQIHGWWNHIRDAEMALTLIIAAAAVGVILYFFVRHRRRVARINLRRLDQKKRLNSKIDETADETNSVA